MQTVPAEFQGLPLEVQFSPLCAANGPEIKRPLWGFLVGVPMLPVALEKHPRCRSPCQAGGFPWFSYQPVSDIPSLPRERRLQSTFLFEQETNVFLLSTVTFCLILCKGSNKHLATCQKEFWYLHRKMSIIVGVVCTLHGPGSFDFYHEGEGGQDKEMEEKYSSGESGADR